MAPNNGLQWLQLLHLADSALPIGAAAHSFGLETLVADGILTVDVLGTFLSDYLIETGTIEASYCLAAHWASREHTVAAWIDLNMRLDALKTAREARDASGSLGRRLLQLANQWEANPIWEEALQAAKREGVGIHHCTAFGLVGGILGIESHLTAMAYLQQTVTGLVSASQRLMPLGQTTANRIIWNLKPGITAAVSRAQSLQENQNSWATFTPMIDVASQRHPVLSTRLFIS
jgi:urease accessory protein